MLTRLGADHARALGVPVVMANMCSDHAVAGLVTRFPGLSSIVDGAGKVRAQLDDVEGVIVADVLPDDAREHATTIGRGRYWAAPMPWSALAWPVTQHLCGVAYRLDREGQRTAWAASTM